jgi:hypothetical protein
MRVITALTLYCNINRLEYYLSIGARDQAIKLLETMHKDGGITSLDPAMLDTIRDSLFLAQLYLICELDESVNAELASVKKMLSTHIMSRELMRKRMEGYGGDIGILAKLPELCLSKIIHLIYSVG